MIQIHGDFLICMVMFMNGLQIGFPRLIQMEIQVLTQLDPLRALQKVARGGSWKFGVNTLRSTKRSPDSPNARNEWVGFRLAYMQITELPTDLNSAGPLNILENPTNFLSCWGIHCDGSGY